MVNRYFFNEYELTKVLQKDIKILLDEKETTVKLLLSTYLKKCNIQSNVYVNKYIL